MKGLCEECLASNIEVKFIKGKTICAKCANMMMPHLKLYFNSAFGKLGGPCLNKNVF